MSKLAATGDDPVARPMFALALAHAGLHSSGLSPGEIENALDGWLTANEIGSAKIAAARMATAWGASGKGARKPFAQCLPAQQAPEPEPAPKQARPGRH